MNGRRLLVTAAGVAATIGVAACGSVKPGHGSPAAVVVGYTQALERGDYATACSYLLPNQQTSCVSDLRGVGVKVTGKSVPGKAAQQGSQALVSSTGHMCISANGGTECGTNHNASAGLPGAGTSFAAAYKAALASTAGPGAAEFWVQAMSERNGRWYANSPS